MYEKVEHKKSNIGGSIYGLQIECYINFFEKLMSLDFILGSSYGLVIRIDNVSHVIDYLDGGIFVSPGMQVYLALDRQFKTSSPI